MPRVLGWVHGSRETPVAALLVSSAIVAGFAVANLWYDRAIKVAVLVAGLTSLIWYILAMICLLRLRHREPQLFARYRSPLPRLLPVVVLLLSAVALSVYPKIDVNVLPLTAAFYLAGMGYYALWARQRLRNAPCVAPDGEVATTSAPPRQRRLAWLTGAALVLVLIAVGWIVLTASGLAPVPIEDTGAQVTIILALLSGALALLSVVALRHTR